MALPPGTRIGRIRIDAQIGAGGMGEVYRGWDDRLERPVALKVVHQGKRLSPAVRARFLREARVLSKLDHPGICRIYDVIEREDGDCLVLELIEGVTLGARIRAGLTRDEALAIAADVARVLSAAHKRGIVHRDLKPENVMLNTAGEVKVLDFGLARQAEARPGSETMVETIVEPVEEPPSDSEVTAVIGQAIPQTGSDQATSVGTLVGTLRYMSPEQANGLGLTEASDIYSLGLLLLEMLGSGNPYGPTDSTVDLLMKVRQGEIVPHEVGDRHLEELLQRMTALGPLQRPTADEVARELDDIRLRPARIRRRIRIAATVAIALTVLAFALVFVQRTLKSRELLASRGNRRIAILPFRNDTHDPSLQWVETGLMQFVADDVGRIASGQVVSPDDVLRAMTSLHLGRDKDLAQAERARLLDALGADVLIASNVLVDEGKYTIRYAAGSTDRTESPHEATSTQPMAAARAMALQIGQRLDPDLHPADLRGRHSLDDFANTACAIGLQNLQSGGPKKAAPYFAVSLDRDPDFGWARLDLARCRQIMGEKAEAETLMNDLQQRLRARPDPELLGAALILKSDWKMAGADYAGAEREANEALKLEQGLGNQRLITRALIQLGYAGWRSGKLERARQQFNDALKNAVARRSVLEQAQLENDLALIAESERLYDEARRRFATSLAIAERLDDRFLMATILGNMAGDYSRTGDLARGEALTRRQLALAREQGDRQTELIALTNLGLWTYAQGHEEEAIRWTEEARQVAKALGARRIEALILSNLAQAKTRLGDLTGAGRDAHDAMEINAHLDDPEQSYDIRLGDAYFLIRSRQLAEAESQIDLAERWHPGTRSMLMRARLQYARGDYKKAAELIDQAKRAGDIWLGQYEEMRRAFLDAAAKGHESEMRFESPLRGGGG